MCPTQTDRPTDRQFVKVVKSCSGHSKTSKFENSKFQYFFLTWNIEGKKKNEKQKISFDKIITIATNDTINCMINTFINL